MDGNQLVVYRPPRGDRTKERDNSRSGMEAGDDSRRSRFPDSQQLFVGNLPHTISEKELKQFFESMLSRLYNVQFVFRKKILSTYQILHGFCIFSCSQGYYKVRTNSIISCLISDFGIVLEVRINRKSTREVPNFGFVVFDNSDSVQKVLEARVCLNSLILHFYNAQNPNYSLSA